MSARGREWRGRVGCVKLLLHEGEVSLRVHGSGCGSTLQPSCSISDGGKPSSPAAWLPLGGRKRRLRCTLVALDLCSRSCGKLWMGRAGWEELECLSSSLQALPQGLPVRLWASPLTLLSHITPCLSSLSSTLSHTGAPPGPPPQTPTHTLGRCEQREP